MTRLNVVQQSKEESQAHVMQDVKAFLQQHEPGSTPPFEGGNNIVIDSTSVKERLPPQMPPSATPALNVSAPTNNIVQSSSMALVPYTDCPGFHVEDLQNVLTVPTVTQAIRGTMESLGFSANQTGPWQILHHYEMPGMLIAMSDPTANTLPLARNVRKVESIQTLANLDIPPNAR